MRTLLSLALLCAALFASAQDSPLFDEASASTTRAIIFGVSNYQDERITPLQYAANDAESFAAFLQSTAGGALPPENIRLQTNEKATSANFYREIAWLNDNSAEGDKAIIYFSGHGDVERITPDGLGFFLTYDCPYNQYIGPWSINLRDLQSYISALESKNVEVIMISDACRSGNLAGNSIGGSGLTAQALARGFQNTNKVLSCQPEELSLEGPQWGGGHAAFTYHLIQGLMGLADENKDSQVTLWEIDKYLAATVTREVAPKLQTPFTVGDRNQVIALVDKKTLKQLQKKKEEELPAFSAVETKGFEQSVIDNAGEQAQKAYAGFTRTLNAQQLLEPAGDCTNEYYTQLMSQPETATIQKTLTRNYAAALWDASIDAFHVYIKSDSVRLAEMFKNDPKFSLYPAYLKRASELLDSTHYMYNTLLGTYNYFQGKVKTVEYFETGKPDAVLKEAVASQEKSLEYLEIASSYYELAVANYDSKRFEAAIKYYQKAIEMSPTWSQPYDGLGALYREQGNFAQARDMYEKALELSPKELLGPAHRNLGKVYHELGEYEKAETHLKEALNYRPKDHFIHYYLGSLYRDMKRFKEAEASFLQTIQIDPSFAAAFYYLGLVYQDQHRYADAEAVLETAVQEEPRNASFRYHLAINHYYQEQYEPAMAMLKEVLEMDPGFTDAYYYLGNCLKALGRQEEAQKVWKQAAESNPKDPEYFYQMGLASYEGGDFAGADSLFLQALAIEEDHPYSLYYLGMSYWSQNRFLESSIQLEKARELIPGNPDLCYQLGLVFYELKNYTKAEDPLMEAIEIDPGYALAHYTLGLVYKKLGQEDKSKMFLDRAKELGIE